MGANRPPGGRRRWWAAPAAVLAVLAGLRLADIGTSGHQTGGPSSSSFATAPQGVAAYAELLKRAGHPVARRTSPPREAALDPASTLIVLDPVEVVPEDAAALRSFVLAGGRLVTSDAVVPWLDALLETPPESGRRTTREVTDIAAALPGVERVRRSGEGAWVALGSTEPVFGPPGEVLVARAAVGAGEALLLADTSPLANDLLDEADNAALGLALAGAAPRPVAFLETVHGYGSAEGLSAIPLRWRWASAAAVGALVLWMLARGRRLGEPEAGSRAAAPPRAVYAHAVGASLARTRDPSLAIASLRDLARRVVAEPVGRGGARARGPGPGDDPREAGARLGLEPAELDALFPREQGVAGEDVLVSAGRALARLLERTR